MDAVASGSLLGIKYKSKKRREENEPKSIPVGFERSVTMYSLSFGEFLLETEQGVIPLEVKAKTGRTLSLNKALDRDAVPYGYKFTGGVAADVVLPDETIPKPYGAGLHRVESPATLPSSASF